MGRLEDLTKGARVRGVAPVGVVTVIDAEWIGSDAVSLTYEDDSGNVEREIVYRSKENPDQRVNGNRTQVRQIASMHEGETWVGCN